METLHGRNVITILGSVPSFHTASNGAIRSDTASVRIAAFLHRCRPNFEKLGGSSSIRMKHGGPPCFCRQDADGHIRSLLKNHSCRRNQIPDYEVQVVPCVFRLSDSADLVENCRLAFEEACRSSIIFPLWRGLFRVRLSWASVPPRFCRARSAAGRLRAWADLVCRVCFRPQGGGGPETNAVGWAAGSRWSPSGADSGFMRVVGACSLSRCAPTERRGRALPYFSAFLFRA